jgi:hypothetical protein
MGIKPWNELDLDVSVAKRKKKLLTGEAVPLSHSIN